MLVVTSLTWLLKSDSRRSHYNQMDGSGSGVDIPGMEMSAESHNRGGSPSYDDEYEYYQSYYDEGSSGYGSGDQIHESPVSEGVPVPAHETTASSGQLRASLLMVMLMAVVGAALQR
ncbi:hypothetical protein E2C01_037977 [Portunus trituberculatus]|uniref:Uncharacterized protein n=1 Tax=Portunus trituberculatus TaxID=210409 RepID=A0A5B7FFI8_PORTR|nr:hypothetical protein [Portunus trituberculatus]